MHRAIQPHLREILPQARDGSKKVKKRTQEKEEEEEERPRMHGRETKAAGCLLLCVHFVFSSGIVPLSSPCYPADRLISTGSSLWNVTMASVGTFTFYELSAGILLM